MKTNVLNIVCFLLPFVGTVFNIQLFAFLFISENISQFIAYSFIGLLIIGIIINIKKHGEFSKTAKLWIVYYIVYFVFATLASAIHDNPANILASIIPLIYVLAFYVYLSIPENILIFRKVALISFVASTILAIYLYKIQFDLEIGGFYIYLDRAQGVFGDANNTALIANIAFVFLYKLYRPKKTILKIFKLVLLGLVLYCLILTYSTTGLLVFIITLVMLNHKFFTPKRTLIAGILVPLFYLTLINLDTLTADLNLVGQQHDKINNIVNVLTFNTAKIDDSGRDRACYEIN